MSSPVAFSHLVSGMAKAQKNIPLFDFINLLPTRDYGISFLIYVYFCSYDF